MKAENAVVQCVMQLEIITFPIKWLVCSLFKSLKKLAKKGFKMREDL